VQVGSGDIAKLTINTTTGATLVSTLNVGYNLSSTANAELSYTATNALTSLDANYHNTVSGLPYGDIIFRSKRNGTNTLVENFRVEGFSGAATFSSTLGINGVADNIKSGTYTPTGSNGGNVGSITTYPHTYSRIGNIVTVGGVVEFTPTAASSLCTLEITLPITSTFTTSFQANGAASNSVSGTLGYIRSGTNKAQIIFISDSGPTTINATYTFQYQIL